MNEREPHTPTELTPNQRLARDIAEKLIVEGLIDAMKRARLETGLAEGNLGADDWRVFVELAVGRERRRV
jgi:hypothetical protein